MGDADVEPGGRVTATFAPVRIVREPASTPAIDATPDLGAHRQQALLEEQEHLGYVGRLRTGFKVAIVISTAFGMVDLFAVHAMEAGDLAFFWGLRGVILAYLSLFVWILGRRPPPSRRVVRALDISGYSLASGLLAAMCVEFGGLTSPYFGGLVCLFIARGAYAEERWRDAIFPYAMIMAAYAGVMLVAQLWDARVAQQFTETRTIALFVMNLSFLTVYVGFAGTGGHATWALRRQVYEARSLGRYKLVRKIGAGGMGEVWVAHHAGMRRDVALKILRPSEHGPLAVQRFEREVQATAELVHPNTIRVFDYGVSEDGIWYYAMELLDGVNFAQLVRDQGPLPHDRAVGLALQVADALAEAHGRNIVHRDIKPENLFVTSAGRRGDFVKVLDFGIARLVDERADVSLTATGALCGTPLYMAPEVVAGKRADARSDVYSVGAVLYFLLVGARPFDGTSLGELLVAQQAGDPPRPSERGATVPSALEDVVMTCLARDPDARYANADALAIALRGYTAARAPSGAVA